uniref:Uncharacterized protein n=1 Tax=Sphaerodactylus townsendi TaxID=933632 RepID=A0ACB8F5F3_9SAUR
MVSRRACAEPIQALPVFSSPRSLCASAGGGTEAELGAGRPSWAFGAGEMRLGSGLGLGAPMPPLLALLLLLRAAAGEPCAPASPCSCRRGLLDCSRLRLPGRSLEPGLLSPMPHGTTVLLPETE